MKKKQKPPKSVRLTWENEMKFEFIKEKMMVSTDNKVFNLMIDKWEFVLKWLPMASKLAGFIFEVEKIRNGNTNEIFNEFDEIFKPKKSGKKKKFYDY